VASRFLGYYTTENKNQPCVSKRTLLAIVAAAQQVHHQGPQGRDHADTAPIGVAVGVITELRIAHPVPLILNAPSLTDQSQQGFWAGAQAGYEEMPGATIQALPGQTALMYSGASLARKD